MKRLMIILLLATVCSTATAEITSKDFESYLDDFLEFLNLQRVPEENLEDISVSNVGADSLYTPAAQSFTTSISSDDIDSYLNDSPLTDAVGFLGDIFNPDEDGYDGSNSSVITNPEPCSIILSSIGLGIAGYLKRRRAI